MRNIIIPSSANYTEFLRDYLKNNTLPTMLSDLDSIFECDFKEEFKQYYLLREIGFDSEEIFKQKLDVQCSLMIPYYSEKATGMKNLFNSIFENGYSITQTNNLTRENTASASRSNTLTNNLTETTNDNNSVKHIDYKTPVGMNSDTLPYSSVSGGYTDNATKVNATRVNTGTSGNSETASNNDTETNTGTITTVYSKNPRFNSIEAITKFQEEFNNIKHECLKSFECLFMQVF